MTPHSRTLRKARENIKWMVADQVSPAKIRNYFSRWLCWWTKTSTSWDYQELLQQFIEVCGYKHVKDYAIRHKQAYLNKLRTTRENALGVLGA